MTLVIRDILICSFQLYMLCDLEMNMLPYRTSSKVTKWIITYTVAIFLFGINTQGSTILNILLIPLLYLLISIILFKGNIWKKLIISYCYYMLALTPEFIFAVATNAYGATESPQDFQSEIEKTLAILLMKLITFFFVKCINQINRKKNYSEIDNGFFSALLMLPMATIIILSCIYYSKIPFIGIIKFFLPVAVLLLLFTNTFIFSIFDRFVENLEKTKAMELLYQKSTAENREMKFMKKQDDEYRSFIHDINKFMRTISTLLQKGNDKEALEIVNQMVGKVQHLQKYRYSSNTLLNCILCERRFIADNMSVKYYIELSQFLRFDFLDELDFISIVGNLLDNAIEAASELKDEGYVKCKMSMPNNGCFLMMEFENNYLFPPQKAIHGYISHKHDSKKHGIGLQTVERLVKKYGGIIRVQAQNNIFRINILFTLSKNN